MRTLSMTLGGVLLATTALITPGAAWSQTTDGPAGQGGSPASPPAGAGAQTAAPTPVGGDPSTQQDAAEAELPGADDPGEEGVEVEAVVVTGNLPLVIRETTEVASVLTADDLARQGDDTAADALTRVTGLSLVGGRFVYVRGLGERYSSALLNGSPLPSPEPLQRVVPLDLFPSSILANVLVQKTYSPQFSGEFGGGVIALTTTSVPTRPFLSMGVSIGGNTETTGKEGLGYYGGDYDWTGFDDGTRDQPDELKLAQRTGQRINSSTFSSAELATIGRSFVNAPLNLLQKIEVDPNLGFDLSAGTSADLGWGRAGVVAVLGYDNSWQTRRGVQQEGTLDQGRLLPITDYDFTSTQNNVDVNALLGFGLEWGEHELRFTNLFVRSTQKEARIRQGVDSRFSSDVIRDDFTEWFARTLVNHQLTGEHRLGELDLEWRAAYAKASRDSPYEKRIRFELDPSDNRFRSDARRQQNRTRFSEIEDQVLSAGVDASYPLEFAGDREVTLSAGYAYLDNDRNFELRDFRFEAPTGLTRNRQLQRPDFFFSDFNLGPNGLQLVETTGSEGAAAYDAELEVHAVYGAAEIELGEALRGSVGLRLEDGRQSVRPFDLFGGTPPPTPEPREERYVLPAATGTYIFADGDMQLRAGASMTIARPQFRELAPSQFIDPENDRIFIGNPFLMDSELLNLDARYEWYFASGQFLTAGLFHKDIERPVEAIVNEAGSELQTSFINAPRAVLYGAEFEVRKLTRLFQSVPFFATKRLLTALNYTYSKAELRVEAGDEVFPLAGAGQPRPAPELLRNGQPLQGQSEHLLNLQLGWESEDEQTGSQATLLLTYVSDRVSARGRPGQPDFVESPGVRVDLTLRKGLEIAGRVFTLGFEARNLLDEDFEEFQELGGERIDLNTYDLGRSVSLSFGTRFGG
ncbi:MAG: outer membrane beta-barrel protein [Proteobacteria bacterium]|nr:outer membrane beta-barrel protein [Pseudomonadota bacterium]